MLSFRAQRSVRSVLFYSRNVMDRLRSAPVKQAAVDRIILVRCYVFFFC